MSKKLVLLGFLVVYAGFAHAQSDDELKALARTVEKAGKMVRDKGLQQAMKVCGANVDSARSKRRRDAKALILTELKNLQVQLRIVAPLAAGQKAEFRSAVTTALIQVERMVVANGGYTTMVRKINGLQIATLSVPEGKIYLNVPAILKTGEAGSGSISADAMVSSGYVVSMGGQILALDRRAAPWVIPSATEQAVFALRTREGIDVLNASIPIRNIDSTSASDAPSDLVVEEPPDEIKVDMQISYMKYRLPPIGSIGTPLEIQGQFDGNSTNTTIRFDGIAATVLAESLRGVVVSAPSDRYGVMTLSVQEGAEKVECTFRNLWLEAQTPKSQMAPGESTTMTLTVRGLRGLARPVMVQMDNNVPGAVILEGGSHQVFVIAPNDIRADGSYEVKRIATGAQTAAFAPVVSVNSSGSSTCEPPQ